MVTIEIFRTDVQNIAEAENVIHFFLHTCPLYKMNFDLEDRDHIFRVETSQGGIEVENIILHMKQLGHSCEPIE